MVVNKKRNAPTLKGEDGVLTLVGLIEMLSNNEVIWYYIKLILNFSNYNSPLGAGAKFFIRFRLGI